MRRNGLRLACTLEHEQLRKNGDRLEIYGKCPQYLRHGEFVIEYERKEQTGSKQVLNLERVDGRVVRGATPGYVCRQRVRDGNSCVTDRKRNFMR